MGRAFIQESTLTDIANAIRTKNGTNNTYLPSQMDDAILALNVLVEEKDVNFYDYDGTLLYSYTKAEALALTALPPLPDRTAENLTNEGWNYTLAEIQTYAAIPDLKWFGVGCTYHTTDDKTHIFAKPDSSFPTIYLYVQASVANDTVIDWGDGSTITLADTTATQLEHTYTTFGVQRDISVYSETGIHRFPDYFCGSQANNRKSIIKEIRFSKNSEIPAFADGNVGRFGYMLNLQYLSISSLMTSYTIARGYSYAFALEHLNLPSNTSVSDYGCYYDVNLKNYVGRRASYHTFHNCYSLQHSIHTVTAFSDNAYNGCNSLKDFCITSNITSLPTVVFSACRSLKEITIPASVTSISTNTFQNCVSLLKVYCKPTTPPSIQTNSFSSVSAQCIFYVPRASCAAYKAATNWSTIADRIYPYDYEAIPDSLYFYMPNGGDVTLTKTGSPTEVTLEYSTDCGTTWTTWVESNNVRTLTLTAGQTMFVRNTSETSTGFSTWTTNYYNFSFSADTYAGGDLRSLLCKTPANASSAGRIFCFYMLFANATNLISAKIKLLFTDLPRSFYRSMFERCTNLIEGPETITATTCSGIQPCYKMFDNCWGIIKLPKLTLLELSNYCYGNIGADCVSLKYVYTEMTDISTNSNTLDAWLANVSPTGDLYCNSTLTLPTGTSGIPTGWTRHDI